MTTTATATPNRQHAVIRGIMKIFTPIHSRVLRVSRGRIGQTWSSTRQPLLLLTTTGRRSGAPRATVVGYIEDGPNLVVVASKGGLPEHPAWYLNLVANPEVTVERNGAKRTMRARVAANGERSRLWETVSSRYPQFNDYQAGVSREIPVVVLEPAE
jgi:F420H(2)-dependent quinone reductase